MLRTVILRKLAAEERRLGASMDYARHILRTSLPAFFRFLKILPISQYRKRLPADAKHVAQIVASRDEDCGTCVQIGVRLARADGLEPELVRAVLDAAPERLDEGLAEVYRFAEAVVMAKPEVEELRERVAARYGQEGLVELALSIASSRFFPIVKRSLGYARSCSDVKIEV